MIEKQETK